MSTSTMQSSFSVCCNTEGQATQCNQSTVTKYYIDGSLIGQSSVTSDLTLTDFQTIIAALTQG